jgi:hypothetical protein
MIYLKILKLSKSVNFADVFLLLPEKASKVSREKKIFLDMVVNQKLKEFVFEYQKKKGALEGLEAFYRKASG